MNRTGQTWEVDLNDTGFEEGCRDVITYVVLFKDYQLEDRGWRCLVLETTPFEDAGQLIHRPELDHESWESRPSKFRRLA